MGHVPQADPNPAEMAERVAQCYALKLRGFSYRRIAEEMGLSVATVHKHVTRALAERVDPLVEQYRAIELDKLESAEARLWEQVEDGSPRGLARNVEVLLKLSERRAKLLGMDAPERQQIEATIDSRPAELIAKIEAARAASAAREADLRAGI